jgi:hypothetical protein
MPYNRMWPAIVAIMILSIVHCIDAALRSSEFLKTVAYHEVERLSEKLDVFLESTSGVGREYAVKYRPQIKKFEVVGKVGSEFPREMLPQMRTDRELQWVRVADRIWRVRRRAASNGTDFVTVEVPLKEYFKSISLPKSVSIRIFDMYGTAFYAMNEKIANDGANRKEFKKMLQSPLTSGFQITSKWGGHNFYSVMPRSSTVILAAAAPGLIAKRIMRESGMSLLFGLGAVLVLWLVNFITVFMARRKLKRLVAVSPAPSAVKSEAA